MKATVQIRGIDETQDRGARLMAARAELEATAIEYRQRSVGGRFLMTCSASSISNPIAPGALLHARRDYMLGELLARIVGHVVLQEPAQQVAATSDREADREGKLVAKQAVIHRRFSKSEP